MKGLVHNIGRNGFQILRTDGKSPVSFLPSELADSDFLLNPFGRIGLQLAHYMGKCMRCLESHQYVDMITHAANSVRLYA